MLSLLLPVIESMSDGSNVLNNLPNFDIDDTGWVFLGVFVDILVNIFRF